MRYLILAVLIFCRPAHAESLLTEEFKKKNIDHVYEKLTDRTAVKLWGAGILSVMLAKPYDVEGRNSWKDHQQMSRAQSDFGNYLGGGIGGALIIGGQYFLDSDRENWQTHTRALIWEAGLVTVLKLAFGTQRPGPHNGNRYDSFPSGHTSTAFATATALQQTYGWKAGAIAYPLAGFVGLSRMADDMHWLSDIVGGAFLGYIVASAANPQASSSADFFILPTYDGDSLFVSAKYAF